MTRKTDAEYRLNRPELHFEVGYRAGKLAAANLDSSNADEPVWQISVHAPEIYVDVQARTVGGYSPHPFASTVTPTGKHDVTIRLINADIEQIGPLIFEGVRFEVTIRALPTSSSP